MIDLVGAQTAFSLLTIIFIFKGGRESICYVYLKEANGFVTLRYMIFLTPKFTRPEGRRKGKTAGSRGGDPAGKKRDLNAKGNSLELPFVVLGFASFTATLRAW